MSKTGMNRRVLMGVALPNGSRLSCGASAGGRKHPALRYELVGAQTHASAESRPRQLQALVRQQAGGKQIGLADKASTTGRGRGDWFELRGWPVVEKKGKFK